MNVREYASSPRTPGVSVIGGENGELPMKNTVDRSETEPGGALRSRMRGTIPSIKAHSAAPTGVKTANRP